MSVEIEPTELSFRRPFTVEVSEILKIKNPNTAPVAFKVKTTAPKQYCVRPNSGRVEPGHEVEVTVLLQAMKSDPPLDARCRDKFLVQSVLITGDLEFVNVQQIWETVDKSSVQEKKIRVTWLPPLEEGSKGQPAAATPARRSLANGVEATPDTGLPAYRSPYESNNAGEAGGRQSPAVESDSPATRPDVQRQPQEAAPSSVTAPVVEAAQDAGQLTAEQLRDKLARAEARIAELSSSGGLRQRKTGSQGQGAAQQPVPEVTQTVRQGTEGVPIQTVAFLCLVSFLLAYFFF
ncbi:hypothetical protein VTK73DRAFT_8696 [Phialemonium thermophilum]|uniref:MSP domain-containing protein n=1 Tax=Phialemonium thermophilum TaxID=223376 RepID=A0ABR3W722_9PEZI